jgi:hypothetical protein
MKNLFHFYPDAAADSLGSILAKTWEKCLVSFHAKKQYRDNQILTIGSGFVVRVSDQFAIVTASRVITDNRGNGVSVRIGEEYASLDGAKIMQNASQDIAFIKIPEALAGTSMWPLVMGKRDDAIPTSSFMIFGYPETKNRIDVRSNGTAFSAFNIMVHSFEYEKTSGDLLFPYNPKAAYIRAGSALNASVSLRGLSGAPVAQLLVVPDNGNIVLRPVGVFEELRQRAVKKLVACSFSDFSDELDVMDGL